MSLNNEQIQSFNEIGFVVIKNFFNSTEIQQVSDWLDELANSNDVSGKEAKYYEQSPISGDGVLVRAEYILGDHNKDITHLLISDKTKHTLNDLLDDDPVLFKDKVNYKLPGCRPDKLHQDQAAGWNTYTDFFITMGIMVDENRKENAAISFMNSGNYKRGLMTEEWQPLSEEDPPYQPEEEYMLLEADPGDVIFFDCYVPHGSPANTSQRCRRNLFLTFNRQSDGDFREQYYEDKWKNYPPNQLNEARTQQTFRV